MFVEFINVVCRMQLSGLNSHRKKFHFIEHNNCPKCNSPNENPEHFFISCPAYAAHRRALFDHLERVIPELGDCIRDLNKRSNRKKITELILFGCKNDKIDVKILKKSAKFVEDTLRFKWLDSFLYVSYLFLILLQYAMFCLFTCMYVYVIQKPFWWWMFV